MQTIPTITTAMATPYNNNDLGGATGGNIVIAGGGSVGQPSYPPADDAGGATGGSVVASKAEEDGRVTSLSSSSSLSLCPATTHVHTAPAEDANRRNNNDDNYNANVAPAAASAAVVDEYALLDLVEESYLNACRNDDLGNMTVRDVYRAVATGLGLTCLERRWKKVVKAHLTDLITAVAAMAHGTSNSVATMMDGDDAEGEGRMMMSAMDGDGRMRKDNAGAMAALEHSEDTSDCLVHKQSCSKQPDDGFLCVSRKMVHSEDTTDGLVHKHGPRHLPSANSSSSNRCKLASIIPSFKTENGSKKSRKIKNRNSQSKRRKQNARLDQISPSKDHQVLRGLVDDHFTFVDGGTLSNPRIRPLANPSKPTRVLAIRDNHLKVMTSHIMNSERGLIYRFENGSSDIILVPRKDALNQIQVRPDDHITLCNAFDMVESNVKRTEERGSKNKYVITDKTQKYICVGNQTCRGCVGIRRYHKALQLCHKHVLDRIMRYFKAIENLFAMYMDTEEIRIIHDAIEQMKSETFSIPTNPKTSASIYGAFACGKNVYLASHTDQDYTHSSISVHWTKKPYTLVDDVVAYFAFPRLGIAVPLRPGDVLFFNPNEPHCVSSRAKNENDVYCVSLYLKSSNIGLNNNGLSLTSHEKNLLDYYNNTGIEL